jgi:hypothetical protein
MSKKVKKKTSKEDKVSNFSGGLNAFASIMEFVLTVIAFF